MNSELVVDVILKIFGCCLDKKRTPHLFI